MSATTRPTASAIAEILTAIEAGTPGALDGVSSPVMSVVWGKAEGYVRVHCVDQSVCMAVVSALNPLQDNWTYDEVRRSGRYPRSFIWSAEVFGLPVTVFTLGGDQS